MLKNKSPEVVFLAKIVTSDVRSTTCRNLLLVQQESGLDPLIVSPNCVRGAMKIADVPVNQSWRLGLLKNLIERRKDMELEMLCTKEISGIIDSLCSS